MSKVYSILCQYNFINGKVYKNENGFAVSPSVWQKHCIGRDALETSIKYLKELRLIFKTLAIMEIKSEEKGFTLSIELRLKIFYWKQKEYKAKNKVKTYNFTKIFWTIQIAKILKRNIKKNTHLRNIKDKENAVQSKLNIKKS